MSKTSIKGQIEFIIGGVILCLLGVFFTSSVVSAIARGYSTTDTGLQTGMVVSLSADGSNDKVERATQEAGSRALGVVTTVEGSLVAVSSGSGKVLVESEGQVEAYVSDISGLVQKGDLLILSPLRGILMKAPENAPGKIIGVAAETVSTTTSYNFTDNGVDKETKIAKIKIDLSYLGASNSGPAEADSALARLGRAIVGKDVGEIRVLIALIVFLIVLIAESGILYGAISSAITALGRNPLARKIIRAELIRVVIVAVVVLLVGLGSVYAILWI